MKLLNSNFEPITELWDDPGDYPSGAGGSPLPSEWCVVEIDGFAEVEIEPPDTWMQFGDVLALAKDYAQGDCPAQVTQWEMEIYTSNDLARANPLIMKLRVAEFDELSIDAQDYME